MKRKSLIAGVPLLLAASLCAQTMEVKLATILPRGVGQDFILRKFAEDWRKTSAGTITLKISPGGQKDGESGIVKKLNSKNYQAAMLSTVGLCEIESDVSALQFMPLTFRSWEEVDFVREKIHTRLEDKLRAKGFAVLFWADAGWVNFFSREKAVTPDEFKRLPIFVYANGAEQVELMKSIGYRPVALETENLYSSFASGMIKAAPIPPVLALGAQIPTVAPHVLNINWSPIVGAGIIRMDVWNRIPPEVQTKLQALCDKAGADFRAEGRRFHEESLRTLQRGPKTEVHTPTPAEREQWNAFAVEISPKVRGKIVPAPIYDEVQQLLKEFRAAHSESK